MKKIFCAVLLVLTSCAKKDDGKLVNPMNVAIRVVHVLADSKVDTNIPATAIFVGTGKVLIRYEDNAIFAGTFEDLGSSHISATLSNQEITVPLENMGTWKRIAGTRTGPANDYTVVMKIHIRETVLSCHADAPTGNLATGMITSCAP